MSDQLEYRATFKDGFALLTFPRRLSPADFERLRLWVEMALDVGRGCIEPPAAPQVPVDAPPK